MSLTVKSVSKIELRVRSSTFKSVDGQALCPVTETKGLKVTEVTLRNHVHEKYWDIISVGNYYFCGAHDCPVVYFNNVEEMYFTTSDVKTRVSHKNGPEPRPICYCLNVLEHKILDEILIKKCCTSLEDVKKYTGARTGKFFILRILQDAAVVPKSMKQLPKAWNSSKETIAISWRMFCQQYTPDASIAATRWITSRPA